MGDSDLVGWFSRWQEQFSRDVRRGADTYGQTQPSYWTIMDRMMVPSPGDCADGCEWFDSDGCRVDLESEAEEFFGDRCPDDDTGFQLGPDGEITVSDDADAELFAEDVMGLRKRWFQWVEVYRGLFMTEGEAVEHLRLNYYHYSPWAHPYYEHAFRAPDVERLWQLLLWVDPKSIRLLPEEERQSIELN